MSSIEPVMGVSASEEAQAQNATWNQVWTQGLQNQMQVDAQAQQDSAQNNNNETQAMGFSGQSTIDSF